jgi:hypothetical protein
VVKTNHDLVEKILNELLLQRPGGKKSVQIGAQELSDEVAT